MAASPRSSLKKCSTPRKPRLRVRFVMPAKRRLTASAADQAEDQDTSQPGTQRRRSTRRKKPASKSDDERTKNTTTKTPNKPSKARTKIRVVSKLTASETPNKPPKQQAKIRLVNSSAAASAATTTEPEDCSYSSVEILDTDQQEEDIQA